MQTMTNVSSPRSQGVFPAQEPAQTALYLRRRSQAQPQWAGGQACGPGPGQAAAGQRQGRLLHHRRGRDRRRQSRCLAQGDGGLPQGRHAVPAAGGPGPCAARCGDRPCGGPESRRPLGRALAPDLQWLRIAHVPRGRHRSALPALVSRHPRAKRFRAQRGTRSRPRRGFGWPERRIRPPFAFPGFYRHWNWKENGLRRKSDRELADVDAAMLAMTFLTCPPNRVVQAIHPQAMSIHRRNSRLGSPPTEIRPRRFKGRSRTKSWQSRSSAQRRTS